MHNACKGLFKLYSLNSNAISQFPVTNLKKIKFDHLASGISRNFCNSSPKNDNTNELVLKEVSNGDEGVEYKLKVLTMEMELLRQEGELVPENNQMQAKYYTELLKLKHRAARKKYLEYLFKLSKKKENDLRKKKERALRMEEYMKTKPPKDLPFEEFVRSYDLQHNNIFLRIRDQSINNLYNSKLIQAMQLGQKLIIDCGFHDKMTARENKNCAKQLMFLFGENRIHEDPYDLHLCNYDKSSILAQSLQVYIPTLYEPEFPMYIHQENYLDLYPKEKLIYLTPHCREEMKTYDHDALYIIGGIVDKVNQAPLSLAKAKEQNLKMLKFPLDKYLMWTGGSGKSLTLNQVLSILLDMKKTGDWKYALRHVPTRKLVRYEEKIDDVANKLLETKKKWTPRVNLDNLSYNRSGKKTGYKNGDSGQIKRRVSVSRLLLDE